MTITAPEHEYLNQVIGDPTQLLEKEWLVTNGVGGYASGSVLGVATRRYHGLFVPDLPGRGRTMIVPRLDEAVEQGTQRMLLLSGAEYADGRLDCDGIRWLREFRREWQTPVWIFDLEGSKLEKRIVAPHGQNTIYVQFVLASGPPIRLHLRPFVTCRMHDSPLSNAPVGPFPVSVTSGQYEIALPDGTPPLKLCLRPQGGMFVMDDLVSPSVTYRVDRDRGSDHIEDLFSPGYFTVELQAGESVAMVASVEPWDQLEFDCDTILQAERQRLEKLTGLLPNLQQDEFAQSLQLAADQFIILPGARPQEQVLAQASGDEARTVIAGYHWFGDWGRDTMISLEGLTLCTGRHPEAKAILKTFARYIKDGLIPNLFPEGARNGLYHTVDATLWYFHALDRYVSNTDDRDTLMMLYPILKEVVHHHRDGTHFNIGVDAQDGLLRAGAPGYQLTWMDAKVDDWVVTPRRGKPVEVQALWYNALRLMAHWSEQLGEQPDGWVAMAEQAEQSFHQRYWYGPGGYLYDVVDGERGDDRSLRPNQIFSLSLRFPVLRQERWQSVVNAVRDHLLTPFGLRSLSPDHPDYKASYSGDLRTRDAAYHQGTVWAWLIGHYIDAYLKVYGNKAEARRLLAAFRLHLQDAGIGTISEIFDAEPSYRPRGCIAQAWSVAEVLRAYLKTTERAEC